MPQEQPTADPTVNPQAGAPGEIKPERTPGSPLSVTRLPADAAPNVDDRHPLPEEAIDGYPKVDAAYDDAEHVEEQEPGGDTGQSSSAPAPAAASKKTAASTSSSSSSATK
jgi:hypothetical protein